MPGCYIEAMTKKDMQRCCSDGKCQEKNRRIESAPHVYAQRISSEKRSEEEDRGGGRSDRRSFSVELATLCAS